MSSIKASLGELLVKAHNTPLCIGGPMDGKFSTIESDGPKLVVPVIEHNLLPMPGKPGEPLTIPSKCYVYTYQIIGFGKEATPRFGELCDGITIRVWWGEEHGPFTVVALFALLMKSYIETEYEQECEVCGHEA